MFQLVMGPIAEHVKRPHLHELVSGSQQYDLHLPAKDRWGQQYDPQLPAKEFLAIISITN